MTIDPIELELMRNLFEAAAEEMGLTLQRAAFSANIKERRDFSCAVFDTDGVLLAQAAHIPVHLGSMPASVQGVLSRLGTLADGDVAIVNDPFAGGTHLPDITLVSPVYQADLLVGFVANRAHHADVGGISPGSMTLSRHIDEEGIRIEPALLFRAGVPNVALFERLWSAVRTPDERRGDLDAQLAANHIGAEALRRMVQRHGAAAVRTYGNALLDYSQSFLARLIGRIPAGTWHFSDVMDDDGTGAAAEPIRISVAIRIDGDRAIVDLRESSTAVPGCINCPRAVTESAVFYCFACLLGEMVPLNGGCFRPIEVLTTPGSLVDAQYPVAVVAGNTETSQRIADVVFGALAEALPDRIPAASCGTMNSVALGGTHAGRAWTYYETIGGGSGGGPSRAGASAVQCHMTNTLNTPAEAIEMQYPLRVRRFERVQASGGVGNQRGGDGIIRELEALNDCDGTLLTDRRLRAPYGLAGGMSGSRGSNSIISDGKIRPLPGKARFQLKAGEVLSIRTPGGGGWGAASA